MTTADDATSLIQARLVEIEDEAWKSSPGAGAPGFEWGRAAPSRAVTGSKSSRAKPAGRSRRAGKRARRGERQQQLLMTIKKMRGASPNELADAMGIGSTQTYGLLRQAEGKGLIVKKGQGFEIVKG